MSDSAKSPADVSAEDDVKARKRAEVEQKVAAARAKLAAEKELQKKAVEEKLKLEQEKEAKKQAQIRNLVQAEMAEKDAQLARHLAQKEQQQQAERERHQSMLLRLRQNPLEVIQEYKDEASQKFKEHEFADAIQAYQRVESCCRWVLQCTELSIDDEDAVEKQMSLCQLSRSLCHQRLEQFEACIACCQYVLQDKVSNEQSKCKAIIRTGQCLSKMAARKGEENKVALLERAMELARKAEKTLTDDPTLPRDLMDATKILLKQLAVSIPLKIDYAKGLNALSDLTPAQRGGEAAASRQASSPAPRRKVNYSTSDSDSDSDSSFAMNNKRHVPTVSYNSVGSHAGDIYGKSAHAFSRQRLARFPGIRNEGATCWGNCILQVVYHLRLLRVRLHQVFVENIQQASDELGVASVLITVFRNMDHATAAPGEEALDSVSALRLWRACETNVLRQNDMHEFFVALIEYFETLFKRNSALFPQNGAAAFFHQLFNLVSQNRISVEEFGYDQPAGDGSNVSDCVLMVMDPWNQRTLRNFLRFKFLEGETVDTYINSKLHDGCADKKCAGHKARLFSRLVQCPDVMCCFLNRIEHNYEDGSQSKNSDPFEYPEQFSMADYVDDSLGPDSVYDLYAVVVHTGAVLAGHYFSFMRPEVSSATGTLEGTPWYRFDDERVYEVEASQALVENFGTGSAGHRRNMWNWQTIKYGRTACMLFYIRRSSASQILESGAAAAAVRSSMTSVIPMSGGGAAASAFAQTSVNGVASSIASGSASRVSNSNVMSLSNANTTTNSAAQSPPKKMWSNDNIPSPASKFDENHARPLLSRGYTDLNEALLQLNRQDALSRFQLYDFDDTAIDLETHEQHLAELGLSTQENAELMKIWRRIRNLGDTATASSAARSSPIDIKFRSLAVSSSALASLPARSVISPDASLLPVFSKPSLTMQSIVDTVSALCVKTCNERRSVDSDDDTDADITTANAVEHLPAYLRAYHPRLMSQLRVFHYRLQHVTGPIEPVVTLDDIPADASLVLCWTISSPAHVAVSVCIGTWGVGDPSPTYVGSPVVVYVLLGDYMRVVKNRAVECFFQRNVGRGEELARRRMNLLNDQLCMLTDSGDTHRIQDDELVSRYYEQDAIRHGEDAASHGFVMNLMLCRD